jgi:hypothetical protein
MFSRLKAIFSKRCQTERGAVTIFLILMFTCIFAFVAIFIDFARIYALQAKTEWLSHAASRSLLSAYDPQLADQYGLFAYGETNENDIVSKVLEQSYKLSKRKNSLPLLGDALESSTIEMTRPLATYSIFEAQIREQMKYKAPIDFTLDIINAFKPMAEVMKEASHTVDILERLQKLYDERENRLDEMVKLQKNGANTITPFSKLVSASIQNLVSSYPSYQGWLEQVASWNDYDESSNNDKENTRYLEKLRIKLLISNYQADVNNVFNKIQSAKQNSFEKHPNFLREATERLREAQSLNAQMEQVIKESEQRPQQDGYNTVTQSSSTSGNENVGGGEVISQIRGKVQSLILPENLFVTFKQGIDEQAAFFNTLNSQIDILLSQQEAIIAGTASANHFQSISTNTNGQVEQYLRYFVKSNTENKIQKNIQTLNQHRSHDNERKSAEKTAKTKLRQFNSILRQLKSITTSFKEHQDKFNELQKYHIDIQEYNNNLSSTKATNNNLETDPYQEGRNAMSNMDSFYGSLAQVMSSISQNSFESEYIASYYFHFDVTVLEGLFKGNGVGPLQAFSDSFAPNKQEIEYILFGFTNPIGNIAAAFGEIFTLRLAIRTMEGLLKNVDKQHPLLILAMGILYGIEHALMDIVSICHEGNVEVSTYFKAKITYRDHLRILLFLHGKSEARLARMLAVIRMNTSIDLKQRNTYAICKMTASMPLWFMPGVISMLEWTGVIQGYVEGGRYAVVKQADFYY